MDLLVGMWAEKNVPKMDAAKLQAMEQVLDQENPDLFKWLTGQAPASEAMQANPAFKVWEPYIFPRDWRYGMSSIHDTVHRVS